MLEVEHDEAPACWACYLLNGDPSGLDEAEVAACNAWIDLLATDGWYVVSDADADGRYHALGYAQFGRHYYELLTYVLHRQVPIGPVACACDELRAHYCEAHGPFPR